MTATTIQTISHTVIVLALLVIFALTGNSDVLSAALGWIAAGGVTFAASKATGT